MNNFVRIPRRSFLTTMAGCTAYALLSPTGAAKAAEPKPSDDALAKHPGLAGMVGIYGYHGPALLTAVHDAGRGGKVKIVCFDDESDTLAGITAADIYGTVVQKPLRIGWLTVVHMVKYLRGDKSQLASGKILIPSRTVTKDDITEFQNSQKVLLSQLQTEPP